MDKVKLAKNRRHKPHIHKHGYITDKSVDTIKNWAVFAMEHLPDQSDVTRQLRAESGIELYDDFKILHFLMQESIDGSLSSTSFTKPVLGLEEVIQDLENVLDSKVCNLKLAVMNPNGKIDYHIDDPIKDRFTCVVQGKQEVYVKGRTSTAYIPQISEVIYLNTSWPHAVINLENTTRLALVGCYDL